AIDGKTPINFEYLIADLNITDGVYQIAPDTILFRALTNAGAERLKNVPGITAVQRAVSKEIEKGIFPHTKAWNVDNLGPIYIPEAGKTVTLNKETLPF